MASWEVTIIKQDETKYFARASTDDALTFEEMHDNGNDEVLSGLNARNEDDSDNEEADEQDAATSAGAPSTSVDENHHDASTGKEAAIPSWKDLGIGGTFTPIEPE